MSKGDFSQSSSEFLGDIRASIRLTALTYVSFRVRQISSKSCSHPGGLLDWNNADCASPMPETSGVNRMAPGAWSADNTPDRVDFAFWVSATPPAETRSIIA